MKRFIRLVQTLAFAVAVIPVVPAFAEQPRGFYMGVGVGNNEADMGSGDFDQLMRDAFRSQGATFVPSTSTVENKDSHLYIFAGYRIFPFLSAEAGFVDLGKTTYDGRGTLSGPGISPQTITSHMELDAQGIAASALGHLALGDYFELHGRLGFAVVNVDADVTLTGSSRPVNSSDSGVSFSPQIGLGAGVNFGDHFSLVADWVHFFDIDSGSEEDQQQDYDYDGFDVDVLRLGAVVRF